VLRKLDLRLDMDDRIALLGQNGNGKSTFIRLLSDRLQPREGRVRRVPRLRIGYFSQDQEESLDYDATPFQHMSSALGPAAGETKVRGQLGRFGFSRDRADLKVGVLSGGEKTRLLLSLATRNAPHLLLLDEPTNHLDMDARASLVDAVNDFEGAVVLVSHDTHLVKMVADQLWVVADGKVTPFDGDIDDYQAKLLRERNGGKGSKAGKRERAREREREEAPAPVAAAKDQRRQSADTRVKRAPLKKTLEALEKNIARLNKQRGDVEARLADPASYSDPAINVADLQRDKVRLEREIAHTEHEWLVAQEAYEAA
jgi:ATP-binding cassette subfamily F protein 3